MSYLCNKQLKSVYYIWDLLHNIITKNNDLFFNIFIETYQINDDINNISIKKDVIFNIVNKFNCFSSNKKNVYTNAMFHYIDYRIMSAYGYIANKYHINYKHSYKFFYYVENIDYNLLYMLLHIYNNKHYKYSSLYKNFSILHDCVIYLQTSKINDVTTFLDVFKKSVQYSKISKQVDNVNNKKISEYIYTFLDTTLKYLINKYAHINFNKIYKIIKNFMHLELNDVKSLEMFFTEDIILKLYDFYLFNFESQLLIMDLYCIGRVFRYYKEYDLEAFKNKTKYSMIYVGHKHAIIYVKIFNDLGFKLLYSSTTHTSKKRCIYIADDAFKNIKL